MRKKILIALGAVLFTGFAFANSFEKCGLSTCGGGNAKCCDDALGQTWYTSVIIDQM